MKKITSTAVLFIATFTLILTSFSTAAYAQIAETLLKRDLVATVKTLKNDIHLYNYFTLQQVWGELQSEDGRKAYINRYLSYRAGSFWDQGFNDDSPKNYAAGAGLYFAIDPSISQSYGNSFIEITVPAGTRFINVVRPIPLKKDTLAALVSEGYLTKEGLAEVFPKQAGFYRDTLRAMVLPRHSAFRTLVQNIFESEDIQYVEYNFNTALQGFCTKHSYSAFNYIGKKNPHDVKNAIVNASLQNTSLYSTNFNFPNQSSLEMSDSTRILKFRNVLDTIKTIGKSVIAKNYSPAEVQEIKKSTFSCDN